jgi:hypothetical protein
MAGPVETYRKDGQPELDYIDLVLVPLEDATTGFVEIEDPQGRSISIGVVLLDTPKMDDGTYRIRIRPSDFKHQWKQKDHSDEKG